MKGEPKTYIEPLTLNSPKYEFRAVWIATVSNIDWPSKKGLPVEQQKQEFIRLLDMHKLNGMNAVIVQIRPAADAFYPSQYEPWSEFLNGRQGLPPQPFYDPLAFMIAETHKRGMEFHAWLNPYRAAVTIGSSSISPTHITRIHPEWFLNYGDKKYFNPGLPEVINYVSNIVRDIIKRYDVDGIHMDDYFYPYRIAGKEFPDAATFKKYGNGLSKDNWRRSNCDSIVKRIHEIILEENPMVRFGISPFGVWRNIAVDSLMGSNTRAGQTNYDDLYADILLWLQKDWIDYAAPQLYWEIGHPLCDYETLLKWWGDNSFGKQIYIGHALYRTVGKTTSPWHNPNEFPNQIKSLRQNNNIQGSIYFSSSSFINNPNGINDTLQNNYYKYPALIPAMNWIDTTAPKKPTITSCTKEEENYFLKGEATTKKETETVKNYVLYISQNISTLTQQPIQIIAADYSGKFQFNIPGDSFNVNWNQSYITVTAVDKENNESQASNVFKMIKTKNGWIVDKK
ncbi:MAG: family 10 glycosylhydrolase [Ferruginibacter sp.]